MGHRYPFHLGEHLWPHFTLYDRQKEIVASVEDNDETYVVAANQVGKDFVAAYVALTWFLRKHPVRIITTSVKSDHLDVLWGEIDRFIRTARQPLLYGEGGWLVYLHQEIRKSVAGVEKKENYLKAQVSKKGEGMAGHHSPHTLFIIDEASGVDDLVYQYAQGCAKKFLIFGNPNPCANFFFHGVKGGDIA